MSPVHSLPAASRAAIAIAVAIRCASRLRSGGSSGANPSSSNSRASASRSRLVGRSRMGGDPAGVEQHQQFELAFGGAAAGDRGRQAARAGEQKPVALLQRDHRPADVGENLPELDALRFGPPPAFALIAAIERRALGDAAGLAVEPAETPALAAQPADILVRVAPAREFPIEDRGQARALDEVIAGAVPPRFS